MILVLDNYDSFTFNLVQYLSTSIPVVVKKNDDVTLSVENYDRYDALVISPGPGRPENSGYCMHVISQAVGHIPVFGVCLGFQAVGIHYGATLIYAPLVMHGKTSILSHDGHTIFRGVEAHTTVMRYNSLVLERSSLPQCLEISATSEDLCVMAFRHRNLPLEAVQFHPESIATPQGKKMIDNFLTHYC